MKKSILLLILLLSYFVTRAQDEQQIIVGEKNEVKLNALFMVIGAFEGTYEYLLNDESGVGISVFLPFDKDIKDDINYYISPYYRFYFGKKYAAGFFLEGFGMLNSVNERIYYYNNGFETTIEENKINDFALGIGLGGKWVTKRGLLGEINVGIGRNLFNTKDYNNEIVAKIGLTVGYRF